MDKALNFIGLCKKAGALEAGEQSVGSAAARGSAVLILTASDAADGALKRARTFAHRSGAQLVSVPYTKDELGAMLGRPVCAVMAVTRREMALNLASKLMQKDAIYASLYEGMVRKRPGQRKNREEI